MTTLDKYKLAIDAMNNKQTVDKDNRIVKECVVILKCILETLNNSHSTFKPFINYKNNKNKLAFILFHSICQGGYTYKKNIIEMGEEYNKSYPESNFQAEEFLSLAIDCVIYSISESTSHYIS